MYNLRRMLVNDVPALTYLQTECYGPEMQEDEATIRARFLLAPDSAWVAEDDDGVGAYLVGYPSAVGKVTPLNGLFDVVPDSDTLYLHDLSVGNRCKGRGVGSALVQYACRQAEAEGYAYSALVSVQGSKPFWERLGYGEWTGLSPVQQANLATYHGASYYMVKKLQ